jgi:hypothetical protein
LEHEKQNKDLRAQASRVPELEAELAMFKSADSKLRLKFEQRFAKDKEELAAKEKEELRMK